MRYEPPEMIDLRTNIARGDGPEKRCYVGTLPAGNCELGNLAEFSCSNGYSADITCSSGTAPG